MLVGCLIKTSQAIRTASQAIVAEIHCFGKQSVRSLGKKLKLSKSAVHRHLQRFHRRQKHPESSLWETPEGAEWLARLVTASLYLFGLKNHLGAGQLSLFFRLLRIDTHVGISEGALRQRLRQMESQLVEFQQQCESGAHCPQPERVVSMDETFFQRWMVLVLMDLPSGYLLLEEPAPDRRYETWFERSQARLDTLGLKVRHAVSDRAKALIKLAVEGFQCAAGADLFHSQYELGKWLSSRLSRQVKQAQGKLEKTQQVLTEHLKKPLQDPKETGRLQGHVAYQQQQLDACESAQQSYRKHRRAISAAVHPFDPQTGATRTGEQVEADLRATSDALGTLASQREIADRKNVLSGFRQQLPDLAAHVAAWWLWIESLLMVADLDKPVQDWIRQGILPVAYWQHQRQHTQSQHDRRVFQVALERSLQELKEHPLTQTQGSIHCQQWLDWAEEQVKYFQRASSAVEGRNGSLAQVFHQGRGLSPARLKAMTVIHNYATFDAEGRTPANRLFEQPFPDLFEWLLTRVDPLPLPRKRRRREKANLLIALAVPA